jgi:hypothetical protein
MRNFHAVTLIDCTYTSARYLYTKKESENKTWLTINPFYFTETFVYSTLRFLPFSASNTYAEIMQDALFLDIEKPRIVHLFIIYRYPFNVLLYLTWPGPLTIGSIINRSKDNIFRGNVPKSYQLSALM